MQISVDLVRRLAKLDPGVREIFYSYVEEMEKETRETITKDDIKPILEKLNELDTVKEITKEFDNLKKGYEELVAKIDSSLNDTNKKIMDIESKVSALKEDILDKLKDLIASNSEIIEGIKSKKDVDFSKLVSSIEESNRNIKGLIDDLKDKFDSVTSSFNSSLYNRVLSKLSKALKKRFNINTKEHIRSKSFNIEGKELTFPLYTEGTKNKKSHLVVGKLIGSPSKAELEDFSNELELLKKSKEVSQNVIGVVVVEEIEEDLEKFAEKKGMLVVWTQDL